MPSVVDIFGRDYWRTTPAAGALQPLTGDLTAEDFRLLADCLPVLCWVARADGYITWYNRRWHDYTGATPDAMEGWGWQNVHDPAELPRVMESWTASIASGEPFEMVFPLRGADGVFRPFLTRAAPVRDASGEIIRWFGVNTEIGRQVRAEAALRDSEAKFAVLTESMPQMVWSTLPNGHHDYYNAQWYEFTGVPVGSTDGEAWNGMFHAEDQERAWKRWRHSLETGEPYEIEYRLRHHSGAYRWTLGRALPVRDSRGNIVRWIGTCTDIDDAKRIAEQNELLSRELSHRIKNIFAVISGLISLSARNEPEAASFARKLGARVRSLARAHEFARPHSDESQPDIGASSLHGLLSELFKPYGIERFIIAGDDVPLDDKGATPAALVFHELATNSAKYGALLHEDGRVSIQVRKTEDMLAIRWKETGGPPVSGAPSRKGFGSKLATISVERQLKGAIAHDWAPDGLAVEINVPLGALSRD